MSKEHKRPLYAFVVLLLACSVVMAHGLRTEALQGILRVPVAAVVAGVELTRAADPAPAPSAPQPAGQAVAQPIVPAEPAPVRPARATAGKAVHRPATARERPGVESSGKAPEAQVALEPAAVEPTAPGSGVATPRTGPQVGQEDGSRYRHPAPGRSAAGPGHGRRAAPGQVGREVRSLGAAAESVLRSMTEHLEDRAHSLLPSSGPAGSGLGLGLGR